MKARFILAAAAVLAIVMFAVNGCGGGGSKNADNEVTPEKILKEETKYGHQFISGLINYEAGAKEIGDALNKTGNDMQTLMQLTPDNIHNYLTDTEIETLVGIIENKIDKPANSASFAMDELISLEEQLKSGGHLNSKQRAAGFIASALLAITAADILLNCWDKYYAAREECEEDLLEEWKANQPEGAINILHVPTAYIACYALALDGFNECKESTALNILTSLEASAIAPFSGAAEGAINLNSASGSIDSIRKNGSSIYSRWNGRCKQDNTAKAAEEEWAVVMQSDDENFSLPEGYWDITVFSDGYVRKPLACVNVSESESQTIVLDEIDSINSSASAGSSSTSTSSSSSSSSSTSSAAYDFSYSYSDPSSAEANKYIVSTTNIEIHTEGRTDNAVTYWMPSKGAKTDGVNPGIIVMHFQFPKTIKTAYLYAHIHTYHWSYSKGHGYMYASTDGSSWQKITEVMPPAYGTANFDAYDDLLPESLTGTQDIWLKVVLYSFAPTEKAKEGSIYPNTAQFSRYRQGGTIPFKLNVNYE